MNLQIKLGNRPLDVEVTDEWAYTFEVYDNGNKITDLLMDIGMFTEVFELIEKELKNQRNGTKQD